MRDIVFVFAIASIHISSEAFLISGFIEPLSCDYNQFQCMISNECISESMRCDGKDDCSDSSDEMDCEKHLCKPPNWFKCSNDVCISHAFVCNGDNDCGNNDDEKNCEEFNVQIASNTKCEEGEWQCEDKLCILESWVCNGESDCLDGSDETVGCEEMKNSTSLCSDGFLCPSGRCIPKEWVCDNQKDCEDNSDEHNCNPAKCELSDRKFRCKDGKTCISTDLVCDNSTDCPDKSDEGGMCSPSLCTKKDCGHECVKTPEGAICLCPVGFHQARDNICQDINECEKYGVCDQKCRNAQGGYECYCDKKYQLDKSDNRTCRAQGGDALMVFSSKTEVRGMYLKTKTYYPIAKKLKQVVGVSYDGTHVYWTNIFAEHESIVRSLDDGTQRQLMISSGLGTPEDLTVDWVTGNVYFTDSEYMHIGVCCSDGDHCAVIVNEGVHKPRAIVLNPAKGEMFWSDWGKRPSISRSYMDGTHEIDFVSENIHWPNGLAIDYPSERLYWTDAKTKTLECIRLDGTDRRVILAEVVKHPYSVAVFEDRLYWSDWDSHSIQSCDKFTGKNIHTVLKEKSELVYGLIIYHPSMKQRINNPCVNAYCSDFCALSGLSYSCLCPPDKVLSADNHTCREIQKKQYLIASTGKHFAQILHRTLGKHDVNILPIDPNLDVQEITDVVYDSVNDTLIVCDGKTGSVLSVDVKNGEGKVLISGSSVGRISGIDLDFLNNNLYFTDSVKGTVEVLSLATMDRMILIHNMGAEHPIDICLIPEDGVMFVAIQKADNRGVHIDRMLMDGTGWTHIVENGIIGPVKLHYDSNLDRVFWVDTEAGVIESTSKDVDDRHVFRVLKTHPVSISSLDRDLFWTNKNARQIYWADKFNNGLESNRKITLDIDLNDDSNMTIVAMTGRRVNGAYACHANCSHICLLSGKQTVCECPTGWVLKPDRRTCMKPLRCDRHEFKCEQSDVCVNSHLRCNGHRDCEMGEDEANCPPLVAEGQRPVCFADQFQCDDGQCIPKQFRCDFHWDCKDKSDEMQCNQPTTEAPGCPSGTFTCSNDRCISDRFVCDGTKDCANGEDELNCGSNTCNPEQFQCLSGACIPKNWECDSEIDCSDSSDEHEGCQPEECEEGMFKCSVGICIDAQLVCNGFDDCGDGFDEKKCAKKTEVPEEIVCPSDSFVCPSLKKCLPNAAMCNRSVECPPGDDEMHCFRGNYSAKCLHEEFECLNGNCINSLWLCDHRDDCGDASDETEGMCKGAGGIGPEEAARLNKLVDCEHGFRCTSGHCIEMDLVCDGVEHCYDGSDESGACETACTHNRNPCDGKCVKTPTGPQCTCDEGYHLMGDGKTCQDVKECQMDPSPCSQECHDTPGSFTCSCFPGYVIRNDRRSCKAKGIPMSIYFTVEDSTDVRRLSQATHSLDIVTSIRGPPITDLDVSLEQELLYYTWPELGTIFQYSLKNKSGDYIINLDWPTKIAVDWVTHNVYYASSAKKNQRSIFVCNFGEKRCAKIISLESNGEISDLVVDAKNKFIFYSVRTWWMFNSPVSVVYRANLDGSRQQEVIKSDAGYINSLAIDFNKKRLYCTDEHHEVIHRVQYDGLNRTVILYNVTKPRDLVFFEDQLFYLQPGGVMKKCKLYGTSSNLQCDMFKVSSEHIEHFTIAQSSLQPDIINTCDDHKCKGICIQNEVGVQCICPDGKNIAENEECPLNDMNSVLGIAQPKFIANVSTVAATAAKAKGAKSVIVAVVIVTLLLAAAGGVFYVRKRFSPIKFLDNSTVRFTNPGYGLSQTLSNSSESNLLPGQHEYCNPIDITSSNKMFQLEDDVVNTEADMSNSKLGKTFVL